MSEVFDYFNKLKQGVESLRTIPNKYEMEKIQECIDGLFSFAKFKVGDSVKMSETYPVNPVDSLGWMSYRHLLKKGSKAKVLKVDWHKECFWYQLEFEEKSWIDDKSRVHKSDTTISLFLFEKWLKAVK